MVLSGEAGGSLLLGHWLALLFVATAGLVYLGSALQLAAQPAA
jgi:hypothetical protein